MAAKKIFLTPIYILLFLSICVSAYSQIDNPLNHKLIVFFSVSCHKCTQVKSELMPQIEKQFKDKIEIEYRDIGDIDNYKLLLGLQAKYNAKDLKIIVPVFFLEGHFLNAESLSKENLKRLIENEFNKPIIQKTELPTIDLLARFKAFGPFVIVSAGLIDGINPCAFTVMVFFISFLTLQGYRKKELVVIGLAFIFSVFLTYILIGIGIFGFLYRMKSFWWLAKIFNYSIGILSIILGTLALYDFFKFKKTQSSDGLLLQLPTAVKNQIHSVIGLHYRKTKENKGGQTLSLPVFRLALSALITGFLVSILEAVCTGQTYLPTISFVLKTTPLKLQALGYLLLYNLMFILPLAAIFIFALWGMTSEQFARALKKNLLTIKILMALLFFGLGIFLIWRA
jgi:cytochrome c biogenesis protein CcdA